MIPSRCQRVLAISLTLTIAVFLMPAAAWSGADAQFGGRVFQQDGSTPRPGVVVTLHESATDRTFSSLPTDQLGFFNIDQAEPGSYALLAETAEGAYLAGEALDLQSGANKPLALTLATASPKTAPASATPGSGMATWAKWTIAGSISAVALFLALDISDDVTEDVSPSTPF
jgi:hypothetical protein